MYSSAIKTKATYGKTLQIVEVKTKSLEMLLSIWYNYGTLKVSQPILFVEFIEEKITTFAKLLLYIRIN